MFARKLRRIYLKSELTNISDSSKRYPNACLFISQIIIKLKKGKSLEVIADELETIVDDIQKYYDAICICGTDKTPEEIFQYINN